MGAARCPSAPTKGYVDDLTITSFAGFFPTDDPQFVILVKLVRRNSRWATSNTGYLFQTIVRDLIRSCTASRQTPIRLACNLNPNRTRHDSLSCRLYWRSAACQPPAAWRRQLIDRFVIVTRQATPGVAFGSDRRAHRWPSFHCRRPATGGDRRPGHPCAYQRGGQGNAAWRAGGNNARPPPVVFLVEDSLAALQQARRIGEGSSRRRSSASPAAWARPRPRRSQRPY